MLVATSFVKVVVFLIASPCTGTRQPRRVDILHVNKTHSRAASNDLGPDTLAPLVNFAHGSSQIVRANASRSNSTGGQSQATKINASRANGTVPFNPNDYSAAIGKVFVFYFSTYSGEKVSSVEARSFKKLDQAPSDPAVFDPETGTMLERGDCKLRIKSQTSYPSEMRKANLRLAELAICNMYFGSPCGDDVAGCEVEVMAPLPYSEDQEPYLGAGIALVVHSMLCAEHADSWEKDNCAIARTHTGLSAGLVHSGNGISLRPLPEPWVDMKLDACYELGFQKVVLSNGNKAHYFDSEHYHKKDDVLAWTREPPKPMFCGNLACLVAKFEQR